MNDLILVSRGNKPLCVVDESSELYQELVRENEEAMQGEINHWLTPFDDESLIYYNFNEWPETESLIEYIGNLTLGSHAAFYKDMLKEKGIEAVKKSFKYRCLYDYHLATVGYDIFLKQDEIKDFKKFTKTLTPKDIFIQLYGDTSKLFKFTVIPYNTFPE